MPQQSSVVATQSDEGTVHVFDHLKHPDKAETGKDFRPELKLAGHTKEGYGLSWNLQYKGKLLGSAKDGSVCCWDLESSASLYGSVQPVEKYEGHAGAVRDVEWSMHLPNVFISVGDDQRFLIWDIKEKGKIPVSKVKAHSAEIHSISFNPFREEKFATASADRTITIWDIRSLHTKLCTLKHHQDKVLSVSWAPFNEALLASCSKDRRVLVWDLTMGGREQTAEDASEGPPELLFVHGGHRGWVNEVAWNPNRELMVASVAEDGILQVWQMVMWSDS
eukprot:TRINITY_DN1900_c0_g1_i13.p1 TRINITY_DN1900_c0_g1~~TRINITY_DN1900_c0_g1_i13.p1  ORF type:complete len:278 (-),score=48.71 TRINITY_DN1900_c0_g1_i13:219-1052(-)